MAKLHTNTHSFIINNNNNIIKEIKNNQVRITFSILRRKKINKKNFFQMLNLAIIYFN